MPTISLELPHHRYDVVIELGALAYLGDLVRDVLPKAGRATLIVDENVEPFHGKAAARSLQQAGLDTIVAILPVSEKLKTLGSVRKLHEVLLDNKMERGHPVVALGGGICGDVAGFVAATYLRGVPIVQCPTTLLAMVDASVGGKTGVNVPQGKNLIGAFHQPGLVVIDPEVLQTLPARELRCGLAECIKHGMLGDEPLFDWIGHHAEAIAALDMPTLVELIERNVRIKANIVTADEREAGVRAHLNLGHTFAHAIEATSRFGTVYKHGEAVALGMVAATAFAVRRDLCDASVQERLKVLLEAVGLPVTAERLAPTPLLVKSMGMDKKVRGGQIRLVLPTRIGGVVIIDDAASEELDAAWAALREA